MSQSLRLKCRMAMAAAWAGPNLAVWTLIPIATLAVAGLTAPALAQGADRQDANARLSSALIRLNHNPRDAEALIAAGNAALATGDTDAAVGFFTRALRLAPDNPEIEAGLAGAKVRAEDPFSAIPLFLAAEKGGPIAPEWLGDRGLAYDLIGDNANAQQYYRQALARVAPGEINAEVSRRLALSLAISGDRRGSETVLAGLLQKQDRAAWRARIFALAILGYEEEAVATARSTMPPALALEIAPYLRYMRRLTPAQQAAAANLGHFPQAAEIGHDDPRVAQYAHTLDRSHLAAADQGLVPAGAPLGSAAGGPAPAAPSSGKHHKDRKPALTALAATAAPPAAATRSNPAPPELVASREIQSAGPGVLASAPPPPTPLEPEYPAQQFRNALPPSRTEPAKPIPQPLPSGSRPAVSAPPAIPVPLAPESLFVLAPGPLPHGRGSAQRSSFADAFAAISPAVADVAPARGAVDLRRIRPAHALPPPPSHPSRIWVELGVGRNTDRIAFDWHRMVKDEPEIFKGKKPFVSGWARTNRLLVGPFETDKAANAFADRLHKADNASAFVWTSPAGQVVDPLEEP